MVTSIARQSVILKCNMQKSVLLGNYEFYYIAGLLKKLFNVSADADMEPEALSEYLLSVVDTLSPKDEKKKYIQVYKANYSGNKMMIHIRIVNNTPVEYIQLQNLEFYVKTADGKRIASYKEAKRDIIIPAKSVKHLTVTIDHPKKKKADLRRAKVTFHDGTLFHYK